MTNEKLQYKTMKTEELIVLAQQDDIKALEEILRNEQKNVFAMFTCLTEKREDVSDLTQEVLLRVAKNIKNLKTPANFKSWLNRIIIHLFYDELRKRSKSPDTVSIDEEPSDDNSKSVKNSIPDKSGNPRDKCISHELENYIIAEINNLPKHFRIAIVLREFQGLSYEEIANTTQTSIGTVKSRISRARNKLQASLKNFI